MKQGNTLNDFLITNINKRRASDSESEQHKKKKPHNMTSTVPISNRYEPLANLDQQENENMDTTSISEIKGGTKKTKVPPPIILKAQPIKEKYKQFIEHIKKYVKNGFKIKNGPKNTTLFIQTEADWNNYKNILKEQNVEYYTFTNKNEKTHAFVLKGLQHEEETIEIEKQLKEKGIPVQKVYRMRTKFSPMYMVITNNTVTLNKIKQLNVISNVIITWEKVINKKRTIQCHRCQEWSHASSNCNSQPKCLKCGLDHWTRECPKDDDTPPKCANCDGTHLASDTKCKVYQDKIKKIEERSNDVTKENKINPPDINEKNFPSLKQSEPPKINPWDHQGRYAKGSLNPEPDRSFSEKSQVNINEFNELLSEIKTLNSLCNMKNMLSAIRDLNKELMNCTTEKDKFFTITTFATFKLGNYGL